MSASGDRRSSVPRSVLKKTGSKQFPLGSNRCPKCFSKPSETCVTPKGFPTKLHIGRSVGG